jgi:hypothetical protein
MLYEIKSLLGVLIGGLVELDNQLWQIEPFKVWFFYFNQGLTCLFIRFNWYLLREKCVWIWVIVFFYACEVSKYLVSLYVDKLYDAGNIRG